MTCTLEALGVSLRLDPSARLPGRGRVPLILFELDARYSVYGERLAGLTLAPYTLECEGGGEDRVEAAVDYYRSRVAVEQAYDLAVRLGPLSRQVPLRPSYLAVSRMSLLKGFHGARFRSLLSAPGALEELDALYSTYASEAADPAGGGLYVVRPPRAREALRVFMAALRARGAELQARAPLPQGLVPPAPGGGGLLDEPWRLLSPPEGVVVVGCRGPGEAAERAVGGGARCEAGGWIASTVICEGAGGRVAVKEYSRMAVKWLPAAALGRGFISYRVSPKSRMAAEYRYLRLLRPVAGTPRVLEVCADYATAVMVREYVEGEPVLHTRDPGAWRLAGSLLARIHASGYAVGDPNPGNFIVPPGGGPARLIDAEQARPLTDRAAAWDVAVFAAYARFFKAPLTLIREALEAYAREPGSPWPRIARLASSTKLWIHLAVAPRTAMELQQLLRELAPATG